jgi:hypothetical protein
MANETRDVTRRAIASYRHERIGQKLRCYRGFMSQLRVRSHHDLSDADLVAAVKQLAHEERHSTARLIACLIEFDTRRLYLGEGCSSLFTYCTQVLHLSEHAAYGRIAAARAARRFPLVLALFEEGAVHLTTVALLTPHLTDDNHGALLEQARHKSKREV